MNTRRIPSSVFFFLLLVVVEITCWPSFGSAAEGFSIVPSPLNFFSFKVRKKSLAGSTSKHFLVGPVQYDVSVRCLSITFFTDFRCLLGFSNPHFSLPTSIEEAPAPLLLLLLLLRGRRCHGRESPSSTDGAPAADWP